MTAATAADYEAALNALAALVGETVLVTHLADGQPVGASSGELVDAVWLRPGTDREGMVFRLLPASTFWLDRQSFAGWRLRLGEGVDLHLTGGAEITITRAEALR